MQNEELQRARADTQEALGRYTELYDLAPVGYLTLGRDSEILLPNLTLARMLGQERASLAGSRFDRLVAAASLADFSSFLSRVFASHSTETCEVSVRTSDATALTFELAGTAAQDASSCRVVALDISARKRAEAEGRALQSQLVQAQKMEAVGQLAGGIAHDFNNILTAMIMQLNILRLQPDVPCAVLVETVDELLLSADRAAALTRQLLLLGHRQPMQTASCDLNLIVTNLTKLLGVLTGERVDLVFDPSVEPVFFTGDRGMIEQVLTNLCINARDAIAKGGRVTISTRLVDLDLATTKHQHGARPGRFVCLRVADTGCGMSTAVLTHVFEPFFTTKDQGTGTGLGLATVHSIAATHGGWVEVETQLGKGSAFSLYLPSEAQPAITAKPPAARSTFGGNERILIVEDEPLVRRMTVRCLSMLGYRVVEAVSGPDALRVWERERGAFDLLLTDMVMPEGLSGLELCVRLRQANAGLKAIITSGYSAEILAEGVLGDGAGKIALLPKPFDLETLGAAVRRCLGPRSPADPVVRPDGAGRAAKPI